MMDGGAAAPAGGDLEQEQQQQQQQQHQEGQPPAAPSIVIGMAEENDVEGEDGNVVHTHYTLDEFAALAQRMNNVGVDENEDDNDDDENAGSSSAAEGINLGDAAFAKAAESDNNLVLLATNGDLEVLKALLISGKVDINAGDEQGYTALMAAVSYGQTEVTKFLLEQDGIEVNQEDNDDETAMHYCRDVECMKLLLAHGGDLSHVSSEGLTPLEVLQEELDDEDLLRSGKEGERVRALVSFLEEQSK